MRTVAIDLDGTLAHDDGWRGIEHIGEPLDGAIELVNALARENRVIIYTTRTNPEVNRGTESGLVKWVAAWLARWGVNPVVGIYVGPGKPLADLYIDDRAHHHRENAPWGPNEVRAVRARLQAGQTCTTCVYHGMDDPPLGYTCTVAKRDYAGPDRPPWCPGWYPAEGTPEPAQETAPPEQAVPPPSVDDVLKKIEARIKELKDDPSMHQKYSDWDTNITRSKIVELQQVLEILREMKE